MLYSKEQSNQQKGQSETEKMTDRRKINKKKDPTKSRITQQKIKKIQFFSRQFGEIKKPANDKLY